VNGTVDRILIGTHTFAARGDGARRQTACIASLRALDRVQIVNVQFARDPHHAEEIETLAVLQNTSNGLTRRAGPMKPDVSEILSSLAAEAVARRIPLFCFTNGDIVFTQQAEWSCQGPTCSR
jgi:hypothetical protein